MSGGTDAKRRVGVSSGELVLFATFPLRPQNPTFARTSSAAAPGPGRVKTAAPPERVEESPKTCASLTPDERAHLTEVVRGYTGQCDVVARGRG